jgi:hypothetical protein
VAGPTWGDNPDDVKHDPRKSGVMGGADRPRNDWAKEPNRSGAPTEDALELVAGTPGGDCSTGRTRLNFRRNLRARCAWGWNLRRGRRRALPAAGGWVAGGLDGRTQFTQGQSDKCAKVVTAR